MICLMFMAQVNTLLFVFLLLLSSTLCLPVYASSSEAQTEVVTADFFKPDTTIPDVQTLNEGTTTEITPRKIKSPALFAAAKDGVIVVIAETSYTKNSDPDGGQGKVDVVSRNFKANSEGILKKEVFQNVDKNNWKTQLATEKGSPANEFSTIITSTVNAERSKLYVFLFNANEKKSKKWSFNLLEGKVNGVAGEKTITWNKQGFTLLETDEEIKKKVNENKPELSLASGSVFVTKEEKQFVFVSKEKFTGTGDSGAEKMAIFLFEKNGENALKLLDVKTITEWYSFFQWQKKIFMAPTNDLDGGSDEVKVFNAGNNKIKFESSKDPIARLQDFLKNKQNFAIAQIKEKGDVLLFTHEKLENGNNKNVYLWMSDGTRVFNTGIIVKKIATDKTFYGSVLHTETELFALYQTCGTQNGDLTGDNNVHFIILTTQLKNIRKTLDAWKNNSEKIRNFYKDIPTGTNSPITDGLVGFLSNTEDSKQWKDEYLNANATIHVTGEIIKNDNGITFIGVGAGAIWPMSEQTKDQPYNIKDFGFTLVTTVKINGNANQTNSILGVGLKGSDTVKKGISLWCSGEGKWAVKKGVEPTELVSSSKTCEQDETYLVVLMLNEDSDELEVYIDGDKLSSTPKKTVTILKEETISHFYFGVDKGDQNTVETQVSIKYVLLYNRPLHENEIKDLKVPIKKKVTNSEEAGGTTNPLGQQGDNNTKNNEDVNNEESGRTKDKQPSSSPPTTEDGAARVGVVGVLCFMLFGVFTLLERYVY